MHRGLILALLSLTIIPSAADEVAQSTAATESLAGSPAAAMEALTKLKDPSDRAICGPLEQSMEQGVGDALPKGYYLHPFNPSTKAGLAYEPAVYIKKKRFSTTLAPSHAFSCVITFTGRFVQGFCKNGLWKT